MPPPTATADPPRPARDDLDPAALELVEAHGPELMATARRWAITPEDAEDAYQRGLEVLLTKAPTADPEQLLPWLKTVIKHEAFAAHRQRERHTPPGGMAGDLIDGPGPTTAHDEAECYERLSHGAEALRWLKPNEVRALVLRAEGLSYREICAATGWTYTKVNRSLSEGRARFSKRLAGIESGAECDRLAPQLSALADGEARAEDMAALRPHLRTCLVCRARLRDYRAAPARVAAMTPPVAAGGLVAGARELLTMLAVRWHQATELAAAHKLVAIAASTAVLAGGGAATVASVDGGEQPATVRRTHASPDVPTPRSASSGSESAEPRDTAASAGGATPQAGSHDESGATAPADRDPAPAAPSAGESSAPAPSAGEFAPDPAPAEPAATKPARPASAATSEPGGGEFAP